MRINFCLQLIRTTMTNGKEKNIARYFYNNYSWEWNLAPQEKKRDGKKRKKTTSIYAKKDSILKNFWNTTKWRNWMNYAPFLSRTTYTRHIEKISRIFLLKSIFLFENSASGVTPLKKLFESYCDAWAINYLAHELW